MSKPVVRTHWGVSYKAGMLTAVAQYDDEESAREMVPLYGEDACVVRCTVTTTPWERVDAEPPPGSGEGVPTEKERTDG
jgi:hypothetical protein